MSRSYWMTLVACACLCVAVVYQHFRIGDLEARLGLDGEPAESVVAAVRASDTSVSSQEIVGRLGALERRLGAMQRQLALGVAPAESVHGAIEPWQDEVPADEADSEDEPRAELEAILASDDI